MSERSSSSHKRIKVALICGGPSDERGISLNSARSVLDHLSPDFFEIGVYYVSPLLQWYCLSPYHLYSNSPSDFDFKLSEMAAPLKGNQLIQSLKTFDIAFPIIHGAFGEDGQLQSFLEENQIPFVGPSASMCASLFSKKAVSEFLKNHGYTTLPCCLLSKKDADLEHKIKDFFSTHCLERAIIKPDAGGSSLGVSSVTTPEEALSAAQALLKKDPLSTVFLEPFCKGKEFTLVVLQNHQGNPVSLIPTEITIPYDNNQFFDYRSKYLPTSHTELLCPPSFAPAITSEIQRQGEEIFSFYGLRDFVRFDGWVLEDGRILFTDFNPISGMEQNSFLFLQAAYVGMPHDEVLTYIIMSACTRYQIPFPDLVSSHPLKSTPVWVVFGGSSAERQVSVMSGTNVWLKLMRSAVYDPTPFFLDPEGFLWKLPYAYCLHHTVEEIHKKCLSHDTSLNPFARKIRSRLDLEENTEITPPAHLQKISFQTFLENASHSKAFVFLGLHGGEGEDGTWQKQLSEAGLLYNGSREKASHLCMDKFATGKIIEALDDPFIKTLPKYRLAPEVFPKLDQPQLEALWDHLYDHLGDPPYIIKPQSDGCSSGIVPITTLRDLITYRDLILTKATVIPPYTFPGQTSTVELGNTAHTSKYILEPFLRTDGLNVETSTLVHDAKEGWLELTVTVFEGEGVYHALNPSITVSSHQVLNVEEKFQGGTGTNITPPPENLISSSCLKDIKTAIEKTAQALGIENYARIDCFYNRQTHKLIIIEANSLPALTPSTVLYHQGLAESPPLTPLMVLELLIASKSKKAKNPPATPYGQETLKSPETLSHGT